MRAEDDPLPLGLPPEQPGDDGAEELARRAAAVVQGGWHLRAELSLGAPRAVRHDTARDVRRLPLAKIIDAAVAVANKPQDAWKSEAGEAVAPSGRPVRGKSARFYKDFADSCRNFAAEHKSPVEEIPRRKRVSKNTVHQWAYRARQLGFLEPSTRGGN